MQNHNPVGIDQQTNNEVMSAGLKVFKISATSSCGTYFCSYLQSVTVIALDKQQALRMAIQWANEGEGFIREVTLNDVEEIGAVQEGVIDYLMDSDY